MARNGQAVMELDRKRMEAMCRQDAGTLRAMLADDLVYTHSSARLDTKQSLISAMESRTVVSSAIEPSEVKAQDYGETVVVTGAARIQVKANGTAMDFRVRFTDVWVSREGQWRMVAWQSTKIPE